jgi:amphi-Trp domain-containing protein
MTTHPHDVHARQTMATDRNFRERSQLVSRQRAAEQLVDIAYALTAGGPLEVGTGGGAVGLPVPDEVRVERKTRSDGDRVEIAVLVSWPA